jgi:hypothetical protein
VPRPRVALRDDGLSNGLPGARLRLSADPVERFDRDLPLAPEDEARGRCSHGVRTLRTRSVPLRQGILRNIRVTYGDLKEVSCALCNRALTRDNR